MRLRTIIAILATCALGLPTLRPKRPSPPMLDNRPGRSRLFRTRISRRSVKGEGMGMAKAAELHGYPGPAHVLGLATQLGLTPDQLQQVTAI